MKLFKNTVSDQLWESLKILMKVDELKSFRLVGGTSLSLQMGHRISIDIDMFTDLEYDTIDFDLIDELISSSFTIVEMGFGGNNSMGKSYFVGSSKKDLVKLDFFYTDAFIFPLTIVEEIRFASLEEIAAMKLQVIGHNGRKKDFWDIHELLQYFSFSQMLDFYEKRQPFGYSRDELISKLTDFNTANSDFEPICLRKKYWELIKLDIEENVKKEFNLS